ncbi:MAG: Tar ligand binding domain-containing protein, partial [Pseudomonadota bacterium]
MSNEDSKPIGRRRSLGIKGRILSSSLAIVAFILLVGAAGLYGLRLANNDFVKYQVLAEQTNVLSRVQANILEAQLAGKNFVLQGKTDSIQIVEDRAATARQYIQDTEALFEDPHAHDTIVLMGDQFEEYRSKFQEVTVL